MAFLKKTNSEDQKKYEVKVIAARETKNDTIYMVDLDVNGVKIYSCILKEITCKKDGEKHKAGDTMFVLNLPQEKCTDGKWYDRVWFPRSNKMVEDIVKQVEDIFG